MLNESRMERVLAALKQDGIDQMLIVDPMTIYYLTDVFLTPMERFYALLIRQDGKHAFFLNYLFNVPQDVGIDKVWYSDTDCVTDLVAARLNPNVVLGVDKDLKVRFLLPLMEKNAASAFVNASPAVDYTRGIKSAAEQEKMRAVSRINDAAIAQFKTLIHDGVTELEVAEQTLAIYQALGAEDFSFHPLIAFGANAADPHHSPDNTVLKDGDCVLFDVGCLKDGYCSDMTRTYFYKFVSEHDREIYDIVRRANEEATALVRPGVPLCDLDLKARGIISDAGYGKYFTHRLGHFIGLSEHEYGEVSSVNPQQARPGMVFSIAPGIYLEGNMGVRLENLILVTETGCESLNHASLELEILGA